MKKIAIGIDFSKKTFDATIRRRVENDHIEVAYSKFENDDKGFRAFVSWVRKTVKAFPEGKGRASLIFCGENTGVCSAALSDYLSEKGFDMWLESALQIKRCSGIVRTKDDRTDSARIADYALRHYNSGVRLHEPDSRPLKELSTLYRLHNMLVKDMIAKNNQIKSGVLDCVPEVLAMAHRHLEMIRQQLKEVKRQLESMLRENEEFKEKYSIMHSLKGVGPITAACVIIKTHNFKYMDDARTFGNYAGVVPSQIEQSGTSIDKGRHVSRCRDRETNAALTQAVNSALMHNATIRAYYDRLTARGVHRNKARNNCKFKMVNIIMAMIRSNTLFDPGKYGKSKSEWTVAVCDS